MQVADTDFIIYVCVGRVARVEAQESAHGCVVKIIEHHEVALCEVLFELGFGKGLGERNGQ